MATTTLNIRIDSEVKQGMENVCKEIGMSMSTAFNIFARKVAREHRIPFNVDADPFYNEANVARIKDAIDRVKSGHYVVKTLAELEAMVND